MVGTRVTQGRQFTIYGGEACIDSGELSGVGLCGVVRDVNKNGAVRFTGGGLLVRFSPGRRAK